MPAMSADPGYGDPLAPVGTAEWAKRWRLEFQNVVTELPRAPGINRRFFEQGEKYGAWTLLTDGRAEDGFPQGKPFPDFDSFCRRERPWGLQTDPVKFRAYLEAEMGKKGAAMVTVPKGGTDGEARS